MRPMSCAARKQSLGFKQTAGKRSRTRSVLKRGKSSSGCYERLPTVLLITYADVVPPRVVCGLSLEALTHDRRTLGPPCCTRIPRVLRRTRSPNLVSRRSKFRREIMKYWSRAVLADGWLGDLGSKTARKSGRLDRSVVYRGSKKRDVLMLLARYFSTYPVVGLAHFFKCSSTCSIGQFWGCRDAPSFW